MSIEFVTTQGLTSYEKAVAPNDANIKKRKKSSKAPYPKAELVVPKPPPLPSLNQPAGVCTIKLSEIPPERIAEYELMRCERGSLKYVQSSVDGMFYDVNYWNARLNKSIPLGRFIDPLTASLAHAIARSDQTNFELQLRPFAVQEYISRLLAVQDESARAIDESANDEVSNILQEEGLDFDVLFEMTS